jgi:hypothetical protein
VNVVSLLSSIVTVVSLLTSIVNVVNVVGLLTSIGFNSECSESIDFNRPQ